MASREKVIRALLKDKASGEFRRASVAAASEEEAVAVLERLEQKRASYVLSPQEVAKLERLHKQHGLAGKDRGRLFTHRQERPYRIVKVVG